MFAVVDNFLPKPIYLDMAASIPDAESVPLSVRSHKDLWYGDAMMTELRHASYGFGEFFSRVESIDWWASCIVKYFQTLPLAKLKWNPLNLEFRGNHIEPRGGGIEETELFCYPRVDIGYGLEGYGRTNGGAGVHIDSPHRIISGLLYFSNQASMRGGEFEVWDRGKRLLRRIDVVPNRCILSVQDDTAWHAVNPIISCVRPRIAIYFALSSSKPLWSVR